MKRHKLTIRNQQPVWGALFHDQGRITIIGSDTKEVAVAYTCFASYELIADFVTETEGIKDSRR
jgi:hypothetical protein